MSVVSDPTQLSGAQKAQVLAGMLLALFLAALDQNVVATAGPDIMRTLKVDASLYTWITTSYLVASTVLVPVYGRLSDLFGRKRIVVIGVLLFVTASVLCGVSSSTGQLIAFRALQGAGSASLFTSAFSVVADLYPPSERGKYSGLFGAVFGVSSLVGPLLGGFITDTFGWHWVFFINLPLGVIALAFILLRMPPLKPQLPQRPTLDVVGALLLALAVVPLLVALSLGRSVLRPGELGFLWSDWRIFSMLALAIAALVGFVRFELRQTQPLVDVRLFRTPMLAWGNAATFVLGGAFLTPMVFLPLFMVNVVGVTATASGLTISPLVMGVVAGNVISGRLVSRFGRYKELMLGSLVLQLVGFAIMAFTLTAESTQREVTLKMVLLGLGLGPSIPLYTIAIQNAAQPHQLGTVTSLITFFRQMGSTVGIAVVGSLFAATLSESIESRLQQATRHVPPALVARLGARMPGAPSEEGAPLTRFDAAAVKANAALQLDDAVALTRRALEGETLAREAVLASPLADEGLKAVVRAGGVSAQVRERFSSWTTTAEGANDDAAWDALRVLLPELPPARPADAAERRAAVERLQSDAVTHALQAALAQVQATVDAQKPEVFEAIDAVDGALRGAFTEAIRMVYRLAMLLAALAFVLTLALPVLPLRGRVVSGPPAE